MSASCAASTAARAREADEKDRENLRRQGQRTDLLYSDTTIIQEVKAAPTGTTVAAAHRRLRKDRPDILAAYERGEFPSARAAAKAAGILKEKTPLEQIQVLLTAWVRC